MQKFHTKIICICITAVFFIRCNSVNSPENESSVAEASIERSIPEFTFDPTPHVLRYDKAAELAKTFKDSVRFVENNSIYRVNLVEGKFIEIDSTFKSLLINSNNLVQQGLRVHFGFNKKTKSVEYYLSGVIFGETIFKGPNNIDTLAFFPEDTSISGNNLDYLKNVDVYKVNEKRTLDKVDFETAAWDEMVTAWVDYQKCILVGQKQLQSGSRPATFPITRSAMIPAQIIQELIQDNSIQYLNIISGGIISDEGYMRQTVFFTHNSLTEEKTKSLIQNDDFKKRLALKQNAWEWINEKS
jgi:hypothetical protein